MRIAHLSSVHARTDARIFLKQCRSVALAGHEAHLVVADGKGDETRDGVRITDVGKSAGRLRRMLGAPWRVYRAARKLNADIYHLHDPELIPIGLRLRMAGCVVVFDAHEDLPLQILSKSYLHPITRRAISLTVSLGERITLPWFSGLVGATPSIGEKLGRRNKRTTVIHNYPLLGELAPPPGDTSARTNAVCYVGGLFRVRGIFEMIEAIALAESKPLLEIGGTFVEKDLEKDCAAHPGWARVVHHGFMDREAVRDLMARSQAGLVLLRPQPNYLTSLPVKMFEYMSAGLPVIASDFPYWRDIIERADCGICADPEDPAAIARAIDTLLSDPERARQMGENGARAVRETYNWTREEEKLLALYARLVPDAQTHAIPST